VWQATQSPAHTAPGGKPYAGGLYINFPGGIGKLATPNITPDKEVGAGRLCQGRAGREAERAGAGESGEQAAGDGLAAHRGGYLALWRRGPGRTALLINLASGACLMLALRLVLAGAPGFPPRRRSAARRRRCDRW
jgi:hypothetical protein